MAEVNAMNVTERIAGRKMSAVANRLMCKVIRMPAAYAEAAINDTVATGVILPAGARIQEVVVRNGTGTASSTIDIGLRLAASPYTVVSATALGAVHAIATASGGAKVISGAYVAAGVDYQVVADSEVYLTVKGAVLAANQALEVIISYITP